MRVTEPCDMKLAMIKQFDEAENLKTITLKCHEDKKLCRFHNHTLEFMDTIKLNSAVKLAAGQEIAKGYAPSVVNRNLQGVKWQANLQHYKMQEAFI